jgi:hypothetical protein
MRLDRDDARKPWRKRRSKRRFVMQKWEYASLSAGVARASDDKGLVLATILATTQGESTTIHLEGTTAIIELNKMGQEGWEVISVLESESAGVDHTYYFLKRPLTDSD